MSTKHALGKSYDGVFEQVHYAGFSCSEFICRNLLPPIARRFIERQMATVAKAGKSAVYSAYFINLCSEGVYVINIREHNLFFWGKQFVIEEFVEVIVGIASEAEWTIVGNRSALPIEVLIHVECPDVLPANAFLIADTRKYRILTLRPL